MTLEPDGTATGCNPVEVGSTPTGVSPNTIESANLITHSMVNHTTKTFGD